MFVVGPYRGAVDEVRVELHRSDTGDSASVLISMENHRLGYSEVKEHNRTIAVLDLMNRIKVNGKRVYESSQMAKCIAVSALALLADTERSFREVADELKAWKDLAVRLELESLSRDIRRGIRFRARVNSGEHNIEAPNLDVIMEYGTAEVSPLPEFYI